MPYFGDFSLSTKKLSASLNKISNFFAIVKISLLYVLLTTILLIHYLVSGYFDQRVGLFTPQSLYPSDRYSIKECIYCTKSHSWGVNVVTINPVTEFLPQTLKIYKYQRVENIVFILQFWFSCVKII